MLIAPVCRMTKFVVLGAVMEFALHVQLCAAAGIVIVQPPEVGVVPVPISNAAVPFALVIVALEPPQPALAIVGSVAESARVTIEMPGISIEFVDTTLFVRVPATEGAVKVAVPLVVPAKARTPLPPAATPTVRVAAPSVVRNVAVFAA